MAHEAHLTLISLLYVEKLRDWKSDHFFPPQLSISLLSKVVQSYYHLICWHLAKILFMVAWN